MADLVMGIDEAGRGCVLGDIVVAGVVANRRARQILKRFGCADSKKFGSGYAAFKKRAALSKIIYENCAVGIEKHPPSVIDDMVYQKKLNVLEQNMAENIFNRMTFTKAVCDGRNIFQPLSVKYKNTVCLDKADQKNVVVAAASVVAKTLRDKLLLQYFDCAGIEFKKYKTLGWGYINQHTFNFIIDYYKIQGRFPDILRKSYQWGQLQNWVKENL